MISNYMKISEFAKVTGITRKNLIFYDKIKLLSPALTDGQNKYRYYTYQQIDTANVITILHEMDMPLKEIKEYLNGRTPDKLIDMLELQKGIVQEKIQKLNQISDMLNTRIELTQRGIDADDSIDVIILKEYEAKPILLGPELPQDSHKIESWQYLLEFYEFCSDNKIIRGLPTGLIISHEDLMNNNIMRPFRFYYSPAAGNSSPTNAYKPQGLYVIGCEQIGYEMNSNLYNRLFQYIEKAGLKIVGDAYEEYLLDEISTTDSSQYLLQISIQVQK